MADDSATEARAGQTKLADFHTPRVNILEAFAELEERVAKALIARKLSVCATAPLGQKLCKLEPSIDGNLYEELQQINLVRADIVHSKARLLPGKTAHAVYLNASRELSYRPLATVMTIEQHAQLVRRINELSVQIS